MPAIPTSSPKQLLLSQQLPNSIAVFATSITMQAQPPDRIEQRHPRTVGDQAWFKTAPVNRQAIPPRATIAIALLLPGTRDSHPSTVSPEAGHTVQQARSCRPVVCKANGADAFTTSAALTMASRPRQSRAVKQMQYRACGSIRMTSRDSP